VAIALAEHLRQYDPVDGMMCTSRECKLVSRTYYNRHVWKPALGAGIPPTREDGMHALRHFYASQHLEDLGLAETLTEDAGGRPRIITFANATEAT
jgi:hypothetical protein